MELSYFLYRFIKFNGIVCMILFLSLGIGLLIQTYAQSVGDPAGLFIGWLLVGAGIIVTGLHMLFVYGLRVGTIRVREKPTS